MKSIVFMFFAAFVAISAHSQELGKYATVQDIPYRMEGDAYSLERCKLDIYYPENKSGFATIVWFHGGGLTSGAKFIPEQLKQTGLAVVAVNYRLMPKCGIADCIDDAAAAVAWVFREIEKYGGNPKQIVASGHSAGGYLIAMIGLDKKWLKGYGVDADSIALLIPFSGQAISHFAYRQTKGIKDTQPSIDEFAPLYHVRPNAPPLIIVSGDRELEMLGRYEENAYFWRMMKVAGHTQSFLYELDGYDHGDMATPAFHILKRHVRLLIDDH
ncbi:MAG: alpha/beta hydrolase [Tannerella sp.]|jgi:acetyl esterase/lipase|nr:alpha/beta hydrolase [Tannerella sp.]